MNTLQISRKKDYVIVQIDNGKVNAIDEALARGLRKEFKLLERDETIKGAILTGRPHCFSAGLDIVSMAKAGTEGAKTFWREYMGALQALVNFSRPLVCAITGYAPAGATILTLCADYRVMGKGEKHTIGMHEFKMSLQIPEMLCDIYAYQLGEKTAWEAVQQARLFNSDEALAIGLINESVEVEEVMERAEKQLKRLMTVYGPVYSRSKKYLRKGLLEIVNRDIEPLVEEFVQTLEDPGTQQLIQLFLMSLKK